MLIKLIKLVGFQRKQGSIPPSEEGERAFYVSRNLYDASFQFSLNGRIAPSVPKIIRIELMFTLQDVWFPIIRIDQSNQIFINLTCHY